MHKPILFAALAALGTCLSPSEARADSDGYYCVGPGYIAFELRSWSSGGPHVLKVVRFGNGQAREQGQVELQDFQPHEMICQDDTVRIAGWDRYYTAYTVDVSGPGGPAVIERIEDPTIDFSPSLFRQEPANLGNLATPGLTELPSPDADHEYRIETTVSSKGVEGGMEHRTLSSIVALDPQGREESRLVLFDGTRFESIHTSRSWLQAGRWTNGTQPWPLCSGCLGRRSTHPATRSGRHVPWLS